jgi:hypothetical protein
MWKKSDVVSSTKLIYGIRGRGSSIIECCLLKLDVPQRRSLGMMMMMMEDGREEGKKKL